MRVRLILSLMAAAACGGGGSNGGPLNPTPTPTPGTPVATTAVTLQSNSFRPPDILVAPSAVVTFTNDDVGVNHNVVFANQAITSIPQWDSGARTTAMPAAVGTYTYTCTLHGGMNGSVKVQ